MDNNKAADLTDDFIIKNIKMIGELCEAENFLNNKILIKQIKKTENFVIFDKAWLDKWKSFVGYEELKEKCIKCKTDEDRKKLIGEVRELFIKLNTKQNLDELGLMDSSNLQKMIGKNKFIKEDSNFYPILDLPCVYLMKSINGPITIKSEISKGIIYFQAPFPEKNKEQKLILLYKENENSIDFIRPVITLEPNVKIKDVVKELEKKNIDEILNQKEYKIEIVKPIVIEENKEEEERKRKEQEEAEKKKKEEEAERKRKEAEAERKRKEAEAERKRKEEEAEEERKRKELEEEERKRKEQEEAEEERKRKEAEAERKRKEAERKRKEQEEAEKKRKEAEEEKKRMEAEEEKKRKEAEEEKKRKEAEAEAEKKKKEEELQKQKEEEARIKKEQEEEEARKKKEQEEEEARKKKEQEEEETRKKKEQEEEEKRQKQLQDEMKKIEENNKIKKERERPVGATEKAAEESG